MWLRYGSLALLKWRSKQANNSMSDKTQLRALTAILRRSRVCLSKPRSCPVMAGWLFQCIQPPPTSGPCWTTQCWVLWPFPMSGEEGIVQVPQTLTYSVCVHPASHLLAATPALVLQPTHLHVMCQVHLLIAFLDDKSIGKSLSAYDCERTSMQLYWGIEDEEKAREMEFT